MPFGILLDASGEVERDIRMIASDLGVEWVRYGAAEAVETLVLDRADFLLTAYAGEGTTRFIHTCDPWHRRLPVCVYGLPDWKSTLEVTNAGACMVYSGSPPPRFLRELLERVAPEKLGEKRNAEASDDVAPEPSLTENNGAGQVALDWQGLEALRVRRFADLDRALCLAAGCVLIHDAAAVDPIAEMEVYAKSWGYQLTTVPIDGQIPPNLSDPADAPQLWVVDCVHRFAPDRRRALAAALRARIAAPGARPLPAIVLPVPGDPSGGRLIPPGVREAFAGLFSVANWTTPGAHKSTRPSLAKSS